jgi:hypothetical protein
VLLSLILTLALSAVDAPAPEEKPPPSACDARIDCRFVGLVTFRTPNGGGRMAPFNQDMPFVIEDHGQHVLRLMVGEMVVVRLGGAGEPPLVVVQKGPASALPRARIYDQMEAAVARLPVPDQRVQGVPLRIEPGASGDEPDKAPAAADTIRFTLKQAAGSTALMLIIDNGYGRTLAYKAQLLSQANPTDVCQVKPGTATLENWPSPDFGIELSNFELIETDTHQAPLCR